MEFYNYSATDSSGKKVKGSIHSESREKVEAELKSKGMVVNYITKANDFWGLRSKLLSINLGSVKKKDIQFFFYQLSTLLEAELSLSKALDFLLNSGANKQLRTVVEPITYYVSSQGLSLSEAMKSTGKFEEAVIMQVASGEESGNVPKALRNISDSLERELEFTGKIKSAMVYPVMIFFVMVVVLIVLMTYVVPQMTASLLELGGEIPLVTQIVISVSNFMQKYTLHMLLGIALIIGVFIYCMKKMPSFRLAVHKFLLRIPLVGQLLTKLEMGRMCQMLNILQSSGISLAESMHATSKSMKNEYYKRAVERATVLVEKSGLALSSALQQSGKFPEFVTGLIDVGASSGKICDKLSHIVTSYNKDVERELKKITSMIEPAVILIVGVLAGTVVISIFLPMYNLIDTF